MMSKEMFFWAGSTGVQRWVRVATLASVMFLVPSAAAATPSAKQSLLERLLLDARQKQYSEQQVADVAKGFGSIGIPAMLNTLEAGTFQEKLTASGVAVHRLGESERRGLCAALATFEWEVVKRQVFSRLDEKTPAVKRAALLEVLGHTVPPGSLDQLGVALEATPRSHIRSLGDPLRDAVQEALVRDPALTMELGKLFEGVPPRLLTSVIEGTRSAGTGQSLDGLSRLLGVVPEADPIVMIEIADLAKTVARPVPVDVLKRIRNGLESTNSAIQLETAKAAGRLDDVGAVAPLIELLRSKDKAVRNMARAALERLSAERYGRNAEAWSEWYTNARHWLSAESPRWRNDLRSTDDGTVSRALLQVARYRIFRYELAEEVAAVLPRAGEKTALVAAAVLGHFGTDVTIKALIKGLDHPSLEVRKAALEALRRATDADFGEKSADWIAAGWSVAEADVK